MEKARAPRRLPPRAAAPSAVGRLWTRNGIAPPAPPALRTADTAPPPPRPLLRSRTGQGNGVTLFSLNRLNENNDRML